MHKLNYLIIVLLILSCTNKKSNFKDETLNKQSKFKTLIDKYKSISFDTLKVHYIDDTDYVHNKYFGTKLDSLEILLLPKELTELYLNDNGYYACYKFSIDNNKTALITRTPSYYEPSSIKLIILDNIKDSITSFIELSDSFGDAGDAWQKISWIFKDINKGYKAFVWNHTSYDHSAEDINDSTVEETNQYYLLELSKLKPDTINRDENQLKNKFSTLIVGR